MKRPAFVIGTTMLLALFVLCQVENLYLTIACCGLFSLLTLVSVLNKNKLKTAILPTVFLSVVAVCFLFICYNCFVYYPSVEIANETRSGEITFTEYPIYSNGKYYCMAKFKDSSSNKTYKVRLSLSTYFKNDLDFENKIKKVEAGDKCDFTGYFYVLGANSNSAKNSFKSKGMFLGAYPKDTFTLIKTQKRSIDYYLKREKKRTENLLLSSFDSKTASIGISLLMGDKYLLENGTYELIRSAGVSHLLAVSGLHLSLWIMFILKIVENLGLNRRRWAVMLLGFDFLIMFFSSFSGSVVRAGIMMAFQLIAITLKENSDSLNSLGLSAVIILLVNPFSAMNVSYLLSFSACLSIVYISSDICTYFEKKISQKVVNRFLLKVITSVASAAIISLTVSVFTFPLISYYFSTYSIVSVITNVLIIPVSTPLILSFGLFVMFHFVPLVSNAFYAVAHWSVKYLLFVTEFMGKSKYSTVGVKIESYLSVVIITVLAFIIAAVLKNHFKRRNSEKKLRS